MARDRRVFRYFLVAGLLASSVTTHSRTVTAQQRTREGLLALYEFEEGQGDSVRDTSGVGQPLHLRIADPRATAWSSGSFEIKRPTSIGSDRPANKIINAVKRSGELTIEAWLRPAKLAQQGPARILTISKDTGARNLTLGQEQGSYQVRLRSNRTSTNGLPGVDTSGDRVQTERTHVVYTRARSGEAQIYLDGKQVAGGKVEGNLGNWDSSYRLALGDEFGGGRSWLGSYELVAIYGRRLTPSQVKQNYDAGSQTQGNSEHHEIATGNLRVRSGLEVLYDFSSREGEVVKDRAGVGSPLDLTIEPLKSVSRGPGSLTVRGETIIRSSAAPSRLIESVRRSGSLTIEAWITPANDKQNGPARIVTLSKNGNERDFTLGQEGNRFDARLRTTKTSVNGIPSTSTSGNVVRSKLTHLVYTRERNGKAKLYVDARQVAEQQVQGTITNWNDTYRLALANEFATDRQWRGTFHLVALYSRSLSSGEVSTNFRAGPEAGSQVRLTANQQLQRERLFETQIAPLLSTHCLECHDTASSKGELDLSRKTAALTGGDSGKVLQPGDPEDSLLWQAVVDNTMPADRPPLSDQQKELLKSWIQDGATWSIDWIDPSVYRDGKGSENWIRRLTIPEYIETVRTAVGVDITEQAHQLLPADKRADGFSNTAYNLGVDFEHARAYEQLARIIVEKVDLDQYSSRFTKRKRLIDDDMRGLIREMGKWIFRGPLSEREVVDFRGITTSVASAGGNFNEAVGLVLEAMLQSPRFLYRIENQIGNGEPLPVNEYELASRMSYVIWGAPPDKELFDAAEAGNLFDLDIVRQQVRRMLDDPRAVQRSEQFIIQWLDLDRLSNLSPNGDKFPNWKPELAEDMRRETLEFFHEVVWKQQRPLTDLLNAQVTFLTPRLAKHYRLDRQSDRMARYDLSSIPARGGLLTQGSLLTIGGDNASMVTRGLFVLNDLLFSEVGDPPPGLDTTPIPPSPGRSHRAIAMERVESASCGGCHSRFEPLAFGLERFDGLGSYYEVDQHGNQCRDDGEILFPGTAKPVHYQSSAELMDLLAASDRVGQCLTRKLTQFSLGRPLVAADARAVGEIHQAAKDQGGTYAATITAIVLSDLIQRTRTEKSP